MSFEGKVALVTGASSGIGRATASALAARGARVLVTARREDRLKELVNQCSALSPETSYLAGDISHRDFAAEVVEETVRRYGRIDLLVNNAGMPKHKEIYRISLDEAEEVMRTNFMSCLWTTFTAIPHMLAEGGGCIVNVSSFVTIVTPTYEAIYTASKGAMNGLSRGLWNDLEGSGIHTLLVHPGPFDTEVWQKLEEPGHYDGPVYSPESFARELLEAIEKKKHEVVIPGRDWRLIAARWLYFLLPKMVRANVAKRDPVKPESVARARQRAIEGRRMGDL